MKKTTLFMPKLITTLQHGYSWGQLRNDAMAGFIVGIMALPLAIAFSIASGLTPYKGLITAVVAGFLISALGGSRVQIGGPTGAFIVIVYGIVQKYGLDGLLVATFLGGLILIVFGFVGLGDIIRFIPQPVTIGFTSGIALLIFTAQIKDFFGLNIQSLPSGFFEKWAFFAKNYNMMNPYAVLISVLTILIIITWQKYIKKIPGSVIAMGLITLIVTVFHLPVATIGSVFGDITHNLPAPSVPHISAAMIKDLIVPAITIAILAGIESLLSAVVADGMIGGTHRSNMELIAQGVANIGSSIFGGMPATGAIARTAVNIHNGGRTPVAGIVHAITLLAIMVFFGKLAGLIPLPCLAGILMIVAYRMAEWRSFVMILRTTLSDVAVLLATFILTVVIDLTVAIQVGMVLAAFLFIRRLAETTNIKPITNNLRNADEFDDLNSISLRKVPDDVEVFEIQGPFFFGIIVQFMEAIRNIKKKPKVRIIRMRHVLSIDASAINALRQTHHFCKKHNIDLILSCVHAQPIIAMERSGLLNEINENRIFGNIDDALNCARDILGLPIVRRPVPFVAVVAREEHLNEKP